LFLVERGVDCPNRGPFDCELEEHRYVGEWDLSCGDCVYRFQPGG
jgi:hypothetical protein